GHAVGRSHRTQADNVIIGAIIAHHTDGAHRQQHGKWLPDIVVEPGAANFLDVDVVGAPQDVELFSRDFSGTTDGEARPWKRMPADESLRQAELAAEPAHLVLEQLAQRLAQLPLHALGQSHNLVIRLDPYP